MPASCVTILIGLFFALWAGASKKSSRPHRPPLSLRKCGKKQKPDTETMGKACIVMGFGMLLIGPVGFLLNHFMGGRYPHKGGKNRKRATKPITVKLPSFS